jgi:hypothetical protein
MTFQCAPTDLVDDPGSSRSTGVARKIMAARNVLLIGQDRLVVAPRVGELGPVPESMATDGDRRKPSPQTPTLSRPTGTEGQAPLRWRDQVPARPAPH